MGIAARFKAALEALRHPGSGTGSSTSSWLQLPGSRLDWSAAAGDAWKSSTAAIAMDWLANAFQQAPLQVYRETTDGQEWLPEHPLSKLLRRPNPWYGGRMLMGATVLSLLSDGNAYWIRDTDARGLLTQGLRYVPHWMMEPAWDVSGREYIGHYLYSPGSGGTEKVPVGQVVHLRYGMDPEDTRKGLSPLRAQLRQVASDNEVSTYMAAVLRNMGVLGMLITNKSADAELGQEQADLIKARVRSLSTGDRRGEPIVMNADLAVSEFGASPEKMALQIMADYPAQRVCSALHVDPLVLGLTGKSATFENAAAATRGAWEQGVLPLMWQVAEDVAAGLGPEYLLAREAVGFDTRRVAALQDDVDRVQERARRNWVAGGWTRAEFRLATGQPVTPDDEIYMTDLVTARALAVSDRQAAPQAEPAGASKSVQRIGSASAGLSSTKAGGQDWADRMERELTALHAASVEGSA